MKFRPTAVPLATCDPFFSVWSFSDNLNDDHTRHWTGVRQSMAGSIIIDGNAFRFMGKTRLVDRYFAEGPVIPQTSVTVKPTTTIYTFENEACLLTVTFVTPLLPHRLEVMSRPASYVFYEITPREEGHTFAVRFDIAAEFAGDPDGHDYRISEQPGHVSVGRNEQAVLCRSGDDVRIEWGYAHLVHPNARVEREAHREILANPARSAYLRQKTQWEAYHTPNEILPSADMPVLAATSEKLSDCFVIAYDDIKAIEYYHKPIDAYYKKFYGDFETMLDVAVKEAYDLRAECAAFDEQFMARMARISEDYANVGALAFRQTIAAHKLAEVDGRLMFFSKENFSNGCMATLDVTYPSIPLFLVTNPELVRGMMRPLFDFARTDFWDRPYAPHDCGRYPLCNGQVYRVLNRVIMEEGQMPVEECGNAILVVAAALRADGDRTMADENRDLLTKWADYLIEKGYNPDMQLCTDDFAGRLEHNCNLTIKAIMALGAFAKMYNEPRYEEAARDMARRFVVDAKRGDGLGYRLTFDLPDTWSMKYNIIWDKLLDLNLFDESVFEEEIKVYTRECQKYGVPLDSRRTYTKLDWMAWTTVMTDDQDYLNLVYSSIAGMICNSQERVPITDWYETVDAHHVGFQARSVLGGFYINLVKELWAK